MKNRKIKVWNGQECLKGTREYLSVYVGAHSVKHALELLEQAGLSYIGTSHFRSHWSPCWGYLMQEHVPEPEVGVWVTSGNGPKGTPKRLL